MKTDILIEPEVKGSEQLCKEIYIVIHTAYIVYGSGYLQSGSAHRRRTLAYLQSRDEPIKALGSSHMTK